DRKCAVLVRKSLEPEFEQHLLLPSSRGSVVARFQYNGVRMAAMSVHFDVFNRRRRRAQAEAVAQLTSERDEDVVLVAGDFNFDPRWASDEDVGTWSMLTAKLADSGEGIGPTLMGLLRIDHVLVRGGRA